MIRIIRNFERWFYYFNVSFIKKLFIKIEIEIIYSELFVLSFYCFIEDEFSLNLIMVMMVYLCLRFVKFQLWFVFGVELVIFFLCFLQGDGLYYYRRQEYLLRYDLQFRICVYFDFFCCDKGGKIVELIFLGIVKSILVVYVI